MPVIALICGGRDFADHARAYAALDSADFALEISCVVSGGARGADTIAHDWANSRGKHFLFFPANWERYGRRAGYLRNQQMLDEGKPDIVLAFPGGKGTEMMCELAAKAGVKVIRFIEKEAS